MLFDIVEYKNCKITWEDFINYIEEIKKEEALRDEYENKYRKSTEYQNNKDKYERILRLGNFQFKTIFDNIYNKKIDENSYIKNKLVELYNINYDLRKELYNQKIISYSLSFLHITIFFIQIYEYYYK